MEDEQNTTQNSKVDSSSPEDEKSKNAPKISVRNFVDIPDRENTGPDGTGEQEFK